MHALLQARGDAVIMLMSDLQDPPEVLAELLAEWEKERRSSLRSAPEPRIRPMFSSESCSIARQTGSPTTLKLTRTSLALDSTTASDRPGGQFGDPTPISGYDRRDWPSSRRNPVRAEARKSVIKQ